MILRTYILIRIRLVAVACFSNYNRTDRPVFRLIAITAYSYDAELKAYPVEQRMANFTMKDLLVQTAKRLYGHDITVRDTFLATKELKDLDEALEAEPEIQPNVVPTVVAKTLLDITVKEFKNYAVADGRDPTAQDTTKATVVKTSSSKQGRHYEFKSSEGKNWNLSGSIGIQLGMAPYGSGSVGGGAGYGKNKTKSETEGMHNENTYSFEYSQEETVCIPPGKKVRVEIRTYSVRYEMPYTVRFTIPRFGTVSVSYSKPCCCGLSTTSKTKRITYLSIVRNLPDFHKDEKHSYFTQSGKVTWLGDSCEVVKHEAPVLS